MPAEQYYTRSYSDWQRKQKCIHEYFPIPSYKSNNETRLHEKNAQKILTGGDF